MVLQWWPWGAIRFASVAAVIKVYFLLKASCVCAPYPLGGAGSEPRPGRARGWAFRWRAGGRAEPAERARAASGPGRAALRRGARKAAMRCCRLYRFGNFRPRAPSPASSGDPPHRHWFTRGGREGPWASFPGSGLPLPPVLCRRGPRPPAAYACGPRADPGGPREPALGGRAARHSLATRGQSPRRRHPGVHRGQCHLRGFGAAGERGGGRGRGRGGGEAGRRAARVSGFVSSRVFPWDLWPSWHPGTFCVHDW